MGELGEEVTITRSGRPVAVMLPVGEYEGLLETLAGSGKRAGGEDSFASVDSKSRSRARRRDLLRRPAAASASTSKTSAGPEPDDDSPQDGVDRKY